MICLLQSFTSLQIPLTITVITILTRIYIGNFYCKAYIVRHTSLPITLDSKSGFGDRRHTEEDTNSIWFINLLIYTVHRVFNFYLVSQAKELGLSISSMQKLTRYGWADCF